MGDFSKVARASQPLGFGSQSLRDWDGDLRTMQGTFAINNFRERAAALPHPNNEGEFDVREVCGRIWAVGDRRKGHAI